MVATFDVWHLVGRAPALLASVATIAEARRLFNGRAAAVIVSGGVVLDARAARESVERELIAAATAGAMTTTTRTAPTPAAPVRRAPAAPVTRPTPAPYLSSKPATYAPSALSPAPIAPQPDQVSDLRARVDQLSAELSNAIARAEESEAGDSRRLATLLAIAEELGLSEGAGSDEILAAVRRVLRKARRAETDRKLQVTRASAPRESAPAFAPLLPVAFYDALRSFGARGGAR
jgi:hypothetical protein